MNSGGAAQTIVLATATYTELVTLAGVATAAGVAAFLAGNFANIT